MFVSAVERQRAILEDGCHHTVAVADLGGVRGVQMHPPLAASSVFLRTA